MARDRRIRARPLHVSKDLIQVSSFDFAKATERNAAAFCKQVLARCLLHWRKD